MMRHALGLSLLAITTALSFAACEGETETLCTAAEEIYCNCQGTRDPGTKTCAEDGMSFGPCVGPDGECQEVENSSTSSGDPTECEPDDVQPCTCDDGTTMGETTCESDGSGFGPCLVSGGECAAAGTLEFFQPCTSDNECLSGICRGFCTRECQDYMGCVETDELFGDCVDFNGGGTRHCAPYCFSQEECSGFTEVVCSGVEDPAYIFAACGPFEPPQGMPLGTLCDPTDNTMLVGDPNNPQTVQAFCHLGLAGVENVCIFGECTKGCYEDIDCPNSDCSSDGSVPGCCISSPDCDA